MVPSVRRGLSSGYWLLTAFTVLAALPSAPAAAEPERAPACFTSESLAFKPGEERVQRGARTALVDPPRRSAAPFTPVEQRGVVRRVELPAGSAKKIALTFDLCEQPFEITGYQGDIVDYLRAQNIPATFFAGGKWMLTHRPRAEQLMADPLFEVANHAWEHRNLRRPTGQKLIDEIQNAQRAYEQVREDLVARQCLATDGQPVAVRAPQRMNLFRFPFGACNAASLQAVAQQGLIPIQWDVSSGDPTPSETPRGLVQQVVSRVKPGSIVLFHANGRGYSTGRALPAIVDALKKKGFEFVTVSALMAAGRPVYTQECYDSRPGDTNRYDALAGILEGQYLQFRQFMTAKPAATPAAQGGLDTDGGTPADISQADAVAAVPVPRPSPRHRSRPPAPAPNH